MEDIDEEIFDVLEQLKEDFANNDGDSVISFLKGLAYGERVEDVFYHYLNRD